MTYELDLDRTASRSVQRVYRRALEKASRVLSEPSAEEDRVHDARVSVKKARALLRLTRHDVGGSLFKQENRALRDAGRALSGVRDATVLVEAFDKLLEHASDEDRALLAPLRAPLERRRDACVAREEEQVAEAARALDTARAHASGITPAHRGWKALAEGLDRAYRRARRRYARAYETNQDTDFHALRKAVKDSSYQARFLEPIDRSALGAERDALKRLGDLLGDDHDLAVLRDVARQPEANAEPQALERLDELATARQAELRKEVRGIAEGLFAEAPKQRIMRLGEAFAAQKTAGAARDQAPAASSA